MSQTVQPKVDWNKKSIATVLLAILVVVGAGNGMMIFAQNPLWDDLEMSFVSDDDFMGSDIFSDETRSDSTMDGGMNPAVTVPTAPAVEATPAQSMPMQAGQERQSREPAALRSRPTPADDRIQIIFTHRQQQPVAIDPNLKQTGESIVNNPQVYSEFV
ncbi:MAG: hypothetical protein FWD31_01050, partial [Planctomycetaceae bacterium]|nr:hypothetical protein [Planctomycetaceae bacterium]